MTVVVNEVVQTVEIQENNTTVEVQVVSETVEIKEGAIGPGVAAGGTTGQYLRKNSNGEYDTYWDTLDISTADITGVLPIANGGTNADNAAGARANLSAAVLGANNDITSMTGVTGGISTPDFINFDLTANPALTTGRLAWNSDDGTLDIGLNGGSVLQVGQEQVFYAKNTSGGQITIGTACMFTGTVGNSGKLTFGKAVSNGTVSYEYMMGVATQTAANNDFTYVTTFGLVRGFNTTGSAKTVPESWQDGDLLYFDPAHPGELTKNQPSAPAFHSPIAVVVNAGPGGSGSIFVRMKTGESLTELHDVKINGTLANNSFIVYDSTDSRWENRTPSESRTALGLGSIATQNADNVSITGGSITGITDLAIQDGGTGASTAEAARQNLGLEIGVNVQAYDAGLQSISGLTTAADKMIYTTAADTYAVTDLTAAGRALLDDADAAAQRTTLGLGTIATQAANNVAITGGAIDGTVIGGTTQAAGTFTTTQSTTSSTVGGANLLLRSEEFNDGYWTKTNTTINANSEIAPDGSTTADRIVPNSGTAINFSALGLFANTGGAYLRSPAINLLSVPYTASFYVKAGNGLTHIQLRIAPQTDLGGVGGNVIVKLSDGSVLSSGATTQNVGNGWYRISVTFTPIAGTYYFGWWYWNDTSITTNGTQNYLIWGAQLVAGSVPGVYTPTTSAAATNTIILPSQTTVPAGSASAPPYSTTGDTNTGIFFPAADTIAFAEGGAEAMRIDSSGRVGIGTSSPTSPLHVNSNTLSQINISAASGNTNAQLNFAPSGTGVALIGPVSNHPLTFRTNAVERMRITSTGNVGIGVTSPTQALDVNGDVVAKNVFNPFLLAGM